MKALTLLERLNKEPYSLGIQLEDLSTEGSLQQVCHACRPFYYYEQVYTYM